MAFKMTNKMRNPPTESETIIFLLSDILNAFYLKPKMHPQSDRVCNGLTQVFPRKYSIYIVYNTKYGQ